MRLPAIARSMKGQSGIIGIEALIIVIALVVVSAGFASTTMSLGLLFTTTAEKTVNDSLGNLSVLELRGSAVVIAGTTGTSGIVSEIVFQVASDTGGVPVDLTPGKIIIKYSDSSQSKVFDSSSGFSVTGVGAADSEMLLEPNELYEFKMSGLDSTGDGFNQLTNTLGPNTAFSLEVIPPSGSVLYVERRTPTSLDPIMWRN